VVLARPAPARHTTAVSAPHRVDSHEVDPCATRPLPAIPIPFPCTVSTDTPVAGTLGLLPTLVSTRSSVHAAVRLATRAVQLVTMTATLRVEPRPPRPRTVVSDTQADLQ
jgi:hypothetical protein